MFCVFQTFKSWTFTNRHIFRFIKCDMSFFVCIHKWYKGDNQKGNSEQWHHGNSRKTENREEQNFSTFVYVPYSISLLCLVWVYFHLCFHWEMRTASILHLSKFFNPVYCYMLFDRKSRIFGGNDKSIHWVKGC